MLINCLGILKKCSFLSSVLIIVSLIFGTSVFSQSTSPDKITNRSGPRTVVDMIGNTVKLPPVVKRVSTVDVLGFQMMFTLGEFDKIVQMRLTNAPWMERVIPGISKIPKVVGVNTEELLNQKVDVVFNYNNPKENDQLTKAGISVLMAQPFGRKINNAEEFISSQKEMLLLYGKVMGENSTEKALKWCYYYDDKIKYVKNRISKIPEKNRPRTFYIRGPDALTTQGRGCSTFWYGEIAGANMVLKNSLLDSKGQVSIEEIITWNPEVIFVGRQYPADLVLKDSRWRDIDAVRNNRVYLVPDGVFFWDGGPESMLLMVFIAKKLYPDQFADLDLKNELKEYYLKFYKYALTDDEAEKLLRGVAPDGSRTNLLNG
jgi:iron complex transport system substrate-binding protein